MSNQQTNIPQGYKQTKVGIIPEDWEVKRLSDVVNVLSGNAFKSKHRTEFGIKWLKIANVGLDDIKYDVIEYLPENFAKQYKQYILVRDDYVIALTRPILNGKLKIAQIKNDETWLLNQRVAKLYSNNCNNISYITKILKLPIYSYYIDVLMAGTDPPNLSITDFKSLKLPIPPLPEQEEIADCLTTWDNAITQTNKLIAAKKQVKKGLMQQLLTGKKRLAGFTEEWREVKFGELFQRIPSKIYQLQTKDYDFNGKYPIIDQGQKEIIGYSDINKKVFSNVPIIVFGDHTRIFKYINFKFIIGADGVQLLKNKTQDNILFLYYILSNTPIPNLGYSRHMRILKSNSFCIPSIQEQTAIAEILQTADKEIDLLEEKLKALEQQKRGLMQVLLTGKKRLV